MMEFKISAKTILSKQHKIVIIQDNSHLSRRGERKLLKVGGHLAKPRVQNKRKLLLL